MVGVANSQAYGGGAGGYTQCYMSVTPGQQLNVIVGGGGASNVLERYLQVALEEEELAWSVSEIQIGMLEEVAVEEVFRQVEVVEQIL